MLRELELGAKDVPFVVVGVLKTEGPTAIKAGNKAIILSDGSIEGWVGGHCTENEIVSNALACLKEGTSRSLNLTTCQGGRMDVYLEPYLPKRKLIIFGHVPIASALASLARSLNFSVTVVDKNVSKERFPGADNIVKSIEDLDQKMNPSQTFAVIATMGERDHEYVEKLLRLGLPYIGVVAGKKRAGEIISYLRASGLSDNEISRVKSPAGINVRAVTAEEIALSIMAEIIDQSRTTREAVTDLVGSPIVEKKIRTSDTAYATDPVCGMSVERESAEFSVQFNGERMYFCCESCKDAFLTTPQKYVLQRAN